MQKPAKSFVRGIAAGMIAGAAVSMMVKPMKNRKMHAVKKKANKALKSVSGVLDKAQDFIG